VNDLILPWFQLFTKFYNSQELLHDARNRWIFNRSKDTQKTHKRHTKDTQKTHKRHIWRKTHNNVQ